VRPASENAAWRTFGWSEGDFSTGIPTGRYRTIIGVLVYFFAHVSATIHMRVEDYYQNGKRWWFRLHQKGGKRHEVLAHHNAEAYLDPYPDAAGIWEEKKGPLFRSVDKHRNLGPKSLSRTDQTPRATRAAIRSPLREPRAALAKPGQRRMRSGVGCYSSYWFV
jgi:hypothetical protein